VAKQTRVSARPVSPAPVHAHHWPHLRLVTRRASFADRAHHPDLPSPSPSPSSHSSHAFTGTFRPFHRIGMDEQTSAFLKMSFETTFKPLMEAAMSTPPPLPRRALIANFYARVSGGVRVLGGGGGGGVVVWRADVVQWLDLLIR